MSAAITLSQTKAPTGTTLYVSLTGTGFVDNGTVTVTVGGVACTFVNGGVVSATGTIADSFSLAPTLAGAGLAAGAQTVSVTDGTNTATATLTTYVGQTAAIKELQQSASKTAYSTP
jgi:hypothetical protein